MKNSSPSRNRSSRGGRRRKRRGSGGNNNNNSGGNSSNNNNRSGGGSSRNSRGGNRSRSSQQSPRKGKMPESFTEKMKNLWEDFLDFITGKGPSKPAPRTSTRPAAAGSTSAGANSGAGKSEPAARDNKAPSKKAGNKSKRKPEMVEVTSPRLYVGNLNFDATESDLMELFNGVGSVQNAEVVSNPYTHRSKGFAFVQMNTTEEAKRAVDELHNKDFMGRPLVVSGAKSPKNKDGNNEEE